MTDRPQSKLRARLARYVISLVVLFASMHAWAQERSVQVAAAADLKFAMAELSKAFESKTGMKVDISYGSSGNFFAQIQSGAPFDLFFSADMEYPKKLEAAGLVEPETFCEYARGQIVMWMPANAEVDIARQGWQVLLDGRVQKIAIANPALAPYGRAAISALQKAGIYEQVKAKLVYGENISQAAQFVQSGNAQAGIIALSLALAAGMRDGRTWIVPAKAYPPIQQGAVMLKSANNKTAARAFLDFVRSTPGRKILQAYGFSAPTEGSER